jgi:hypothetical protein
MKLYQEIDLPPIPKELLVLDNCEWVKSVKDTSYGNQLTKNGQLITNCTYDYYRIIHQPLQDWLMNTVAGAKEPQLQFQQVTPHGAVGTFAVHSDIKRMCSLNYIVDTGGDNVVTSWYQGVGKPLRRKMKSGGNQTDDGAVYYNDIELLDSVVTQKDKWYLMCTDVLHDVDNITRPRKSISLPYFIIIIDYFWDKIFEVKNENT